MNRKSVGEAGEAGAAAWLAGRGYAVVDTHVRPEGGMARGEIDIVAWDGLTLAFVEVKTRTARAGAQGTGAEAVDRRKRRQIISLALAYLAKHGLDDVPCRFDVVEVVNRQSAPPVYTLLANAFDAGDCA